MIQKGDMQMRTIDDCTYQEYKEHVESAFSLWEKEPEKWTPEAVTNFLEHEEEYADYPLVGTSRLLYFLAIGERETRYDILEYRIENAIAYHIYRYENMGRYKADLTPEEIEEVEKDIAYIKSKVKLPELVSYEDME